MSRSDLESVLQSGAQRLRVVALEVGERRAALGLAEKEYETKVGGEWCVVEGDPPNAIEWKTKCAADLLDMIRFYQKQLREKDRELIEALARLGGMHEMVLAIVASEEF